MTGATGAGDTGLRRLVPRRVRARVWVVLRTTPALGGPTRLLERVLRPYRPVGGLGVPAGRQAPVPVEGEPVPVVVLLGLGLDPDSVAAWAGVVAAAQADGLALRPLWLLDSPAFTRLLPHGWAADHVMPRTAYERAGAVLPFDAYVAERLRIWHDRTGGAPVLTLLGVPDAGPVGVARLRTAVLALSAPAPARAAGRNRSRS